MPVATDTLILIMKLDIFGGLPVIARLAMDMISVTITSNSLLLGN